MKTTRLIKRNLIWYRRVNLAVILGVATAVAVLAGALLVGNSVRQSLRELALSRLGQTDLLIGGPVGGSRFFRQSLLAEMKAGPKFRSTFTDAAALITLTGVATRDENRSRAGDVQVYGIDAGFESFHGVKIGSLEPGEALISPVLAAELGARPGEMLALQIEMPTAIPIESLHGRRDETGRMIRLSLRGILPSSSLGEFSLQPRQGAVRAIFMPLDELQRNLDQDGRVNTLLLAVRPGVTDSRRIADELIRDHFTPADLGVKVRRLPTDGGDTTISVETESAIISDPLAAVIRQTAADLGLRSDSFLSYLANALRIGEREVPYSLVTAVDSGLLPGLVPSAAADRPPILLNDWAARDLAARVGDEVTLDYYVWKDEGRLATASNTFRLAGIVPMTGLAADRHLAPEYPGITGAESLSDWDPPFPLDLGRVRKVDEEYWDRYRATPKAFLLLDDARPLWATRHGGLTSIRLGAVDESAVTAAIRRSLGPELGGFSAIPVRELAAEASHGATDFGAYFSYFSFFLVVSALLLVVLFFRLGIEQRSREIGLYRSLGYPPSTIRSIFLQEGVLLALLGGLAGLVGAVIYAALMIIGLRTVWVGAVGTRLLGLRLDPLSLLAGLLGGLSAAVLCIRWTLHTIRLDSPRRQLAGVIASPRHPVDRRARLLRPLLALSFALAGVLLILLAAARAIQPAGGFFGAGSLLLLSLLTIWDWWLRLERRAASPVLRSSQSWRGLAALGWRSAQTRPARSLLSVALIAAATFIIVSVESFRRGEAIPVTDLHSGTGGFTLIAESLFPIADNPDLADGREALNLTDPLLNDIRLTRLRLHAGDDTSCLNLYQPRHPRVLGLPPEFVAANRFTFKSAIEPLTNPWELLNRKDGPVPIIVDANSMNYVLHRRLGEVFPITAGNGQPVEVRIVAALADSLLQGELLMSESHFVRLYPNDGGYRWFGVEIPPSRLGDLAAVSAMLEDRLSDYGLDATNAAVKQASFHEVENTYLSTFQSIGGLGLLLGTIGLGAVLLRNVLERRRELALLMAVGYRRIHLAVIILAENLLLLASGLLAGIVSALLAILPALTERGGEVSLASLASLGLILIAVVVTGCGASLLAVRAAVNSPILESLRSES